MLINKNDANFLQIIVLGEQLSVFFKKNNYLEVNLY